MNANIQHVSPEEFVEVKWSSENDRIATVISNGYVYPKAAGETNIVATLVSGKGTAKCKVIINDGDDYKYRLVLKDKGASNFFISTPGPSFLQSP